MNNPHHDARPILHSRKQIVSRVIAGQKTSAVAAAFDVWLRTVRKWPARVAGRLPGSTLALIVHLRLSLRMTGAAIAAKLGLAQSTVSRWPGRGGGWDGLRRWVHQSPCAAIRASARAS